MNEQRVAVEPRNDNRLYRGFDSLFDDFKRSFDNMMAPFLPMRAWEPSRMDALPTRAALVDIIDQGHQYLIKAELPGYSKEMVKIELNNDTLNIRAERKLEKAANDQEFVHRERSYSASQRTINFPEEVDPDLAEGTMENGVLNLEIPKREPSPQRKMKQIKLH
ncbi:MAG: Hsp20/alpha crystallin family protein [Promethearchaeota archaeon]